MLVDDEEDFLFVMKRALRKEGYEVITSHNASGLFETLEADKPDLILLDITMEGVSGRDICRLIKQHPHFRSTPVLLFSANRNLADIAAECGADGFVHKPFEMADVKHTFTRVLGSTKKRN